SGPMAHLRMAPGPDHLDLDRLRPGNAMERQVAVYLQRLIIDLLDFTALELDLRKFGSGKEIRSFEVPVAVFIVRVHAPRIDLDFERICRGIGGVQSKVTPNLIEATPEAPKSHMLDAEKHRRVNRIDFIGVRGTYAERKNQCRYGSKIEASCL